MGDAKIEGAAKDRPAVLEIVDAAEILPQAERDCRKIEAAAAAAPVWHASVVTLRIGAILLGDHAPSSTVPRRRSERGRNRLAQRLGPELRIVGRTALEHLVGARVELAQPAVAVDHSPTQHITELFVA